MSPLIIYLLTYIWYRQAWEPKRLSGHKWAGTNRDQQTNGDDYEWVVVSMNKGWWATHKAWARAGVGWVEAGAGMSEGGECSGGDNDGGSASRNGSSRAGVGAGASAATGVAPAAAAAAVRAAAGAGVLHGLPLPPPLSHLLFFL